MQKLQLKQRDLFDDWIMFKKNDFTNPSLQLKKQGANFYKSDYYSEFTYRPNNFSPPSVQEFYESILNGIIKRNQLGLYRGNYYFYQELQNCVHEFVKLLNYKSELLVEVFQQVTNLNLSCEQLPNIVVPCSSCGMFIYTTFYCKQCYSAFYCDKTCLKKDKNQHDIECEGMSRITPNLYYPLQIEIHSGGDLGNNILIYFEHEMRISLKQRGNKFLQSFYKEQLLRNRWIKNNGYSILLNMDENFITCSYDSQKSVADKNNIDIQQKFMNDDDLFIKLPIILEIRVLLLNQGAILQDIIKETYDQNNHYVHIFYVPF